MAKSNIKAAQIQDELIDSLGETGDAKVKSGGLYVKTDENADWQFVGTVEDEAEAKTAVSEYFSR